MALISCPECSKEISDKAQSCPNCGIPINSVFPEISKTELNYTETVASNEAAVQGCVGCMAGSMTMWLAIIVGGLLCLTGIGAFVGVPLIFFGILIPFVLPFLTGAAGSMSRKGACPYCSNQISSYTTAFDCIFCKKRIIVKDNKFYKV